MGNCRVKPAEKSGVPEGIPDLLVSAPGKSGVTPRLAWLEGDKSDGAYGEFVGEARRIAREWTGGGRGAGGYNALLVGLDRPLTEFDVAVMNSLEMAEGGVDESIWGAYREGEAKWRDYLSDDGAMGDVVRKFHARSKAEISGSVNAVLNTLNNNPLRAGMAGLVADAHWQVVMEIHPFHDRNERTAQRLVSVFLGRAGWPPFRPEYGSDEWEEYIRSETGKDQALYVNLKPGSPYPASYDERHSPYRKECFGRFMEEYFRRRGYPKPA